jgi:hypothetical protein
MLAVCPAADPPARPGYVGVGGCAASGCHGGGDRVGVRGSEFTTWATADPHHKAYAVLLTEAGQRMTRLYRRNPTADAGKDTACLACHAPQASTDISLRTDGVGCEACHGPAQNWRTTHYLNDWRNLDSAAKAKQGFIPTRDLTGRIQACVECHVGKPGMEVDHDLIAAGHPRLTFEYAAYHDIYPKHWVEPAGANFAVKAWAVGQVITASAQTRLIAEHARSKRGPELADLNCYSCHRGLTGEATDTTTRPPGALTANDWAFAGLASVGELGGAFAPPSPVDVQPLLNLVGQPGSKPADVEHAAAKLQAALDKWAVELDKVPAADIAGARNVFSRLADTRATNWDRAAQTYLAMAALHRSLPASPARQASLGRVRDTLRFPHGINSPAGFSLSAFQTALKGVAP